MNTLTFKTNLKCSGCVAGVKPNLDALSEIKSWNVDLTSEDKLLIVEGDINASEIQKAFEQAGYQAELKG